MPDVYYDCPKCEAKYKAYLAILKQRLTEYYGLVSPAEYSKFVKVYEDFENQAQQVKNWLNALKCLD